MSEVQSVTAPGPGAILRQARTERGLSVADVAGRLKYGVRQIEALEADDYARLSGATFVRGMIRGYAKLLGIDAGPALDTLRRHEVPLPVAMETRSEVIPFPEGHKRGTRTYLALSALLLVAGAAVLYEWRANVSPPSEARAPEPGNAPVAAASEAPPAPREAEPSRPAEAAPGPPAPDSTALAQAQPAGESAAAPRSGRRRIVLEFVRESWVEIRNGNGRILLSQLNPGGTQKVIEGTPPFSLVIGNASHVHLAYNDAPVDLKPYVKVEVARLTLE